MNDSIHDGVSDRGLTEPFMPMIDRQLAGDQGRFSYVTVLKYLEQVAALLTRRRSQPPVVQYQQVNL